MTRGHLLLMASLKLSR